MSKDFFDPFALYKKKKPKKTNDLSDTKKYITDKGDDEKQKPSPKKLTTGKVAGNPKEGDNQVKNDMLKHGYYGYEKAIGSKPAPGGAGGENSRY